MPFHTRLQTRTERRLFAGIGSICLASSLVGCGIGGSSTGLTSASAGAVAGVSTAQGRVHGGNQPISGATIQLYAAGTPASGSGYGVGATPLLPTGANAITTASDGTFTITGKYTCPTPAAQVYIVATGGNPGLTPTAPATSINNNYIAMMTALGACPAGGNLLATIPNININEVTTVAGVWALQQFMAAPASANTLQPVIGAPTTSYATGTSVGSVQSAVIGLNNAFITAKVMADVNTGASPNTNYAYATPESAKINTFADILAYCVNSDPTQSNNCSQLMTAATPSGKTAATDLIQAAWYMAQNTTNNLTTLYNFVTSTPPFQPTYLAPLTLNSTNTGPATNALNDTTIAINYAPVSGTTFTNGAGYGIAIDAYGNAWVSNTGTGTTAASVAELGIDGSQLVAPTATYTVSTTGGSYSQFTTAPTTNTATFNAPKVVAIDLNNNAWITNDLQAVGTPVASSVAVFTGSTTSGTGGTGGGSGSTGYYVGDTPWGVAVDGSNNVYVSNGATPSTSVMDGRSIAKLTASNGTYAYSTSSVATAPSALPGGQALLAVDTNTNVSGGIVWAANYNTCKVAGQFFIGTVGSTSVTSTPFGLLSQYNTSLGTLSGSEIATSLSNATVGAGSTSNCGSSSVSIGQVLTAGMANPYGIAIDRNNGIWLSDVFTSSTGFDGITYIAAPTASTGIVPSSTYVVNGVQPTTSTAGTAGTTLTKAGADAIDGNNNVWIANQTAKSIVEATLSGSNIVFLTPGAGGNYGTTGAAYGIGFVHNSAGSTGIAVDPSGNVWVTNSSSSTYTNQAATTTQIGNSVTVLVGAAGPVVTPLALAVKANKLGQKP